MATDQKSIELTIYSVIFRLFSKYLTHKKQPSGIDKSNGVNSAIPGNPNFLFTCTMILFFLVNIFFGVPFFTALFSAAFFTFFIVQALRLTKIITPTKPPVEVTTTVFKKEKPNPNAKGTAPKTNLTVLNNQTKIICQISSTQYLFIIFLQKPGHLRHPAPEQCMHCCLIPYLQTRSKNLYLQEKYHLHISPLLH